MLPSNVSEENESKDERREPKRPSSVPTTNARVPVSEQSCADRQDDRKEQNDGKAKIREKRGPRLDWPSPRPHDSEKDRPSLVSGRFESKLILRHLIRRPHPCRSGITRC